MFRGRKRVDLKVLPAHTILESAHHVDPLRMTHHFNALVGLWALKAVSTLVNSINESTKTESIT